MNLSPYPNLRKAEKIKLTLRISVYLYKKIFIRFILLISYVTNNRKSVYSKVILFLISSDWFSAIIVGEIYIFIRFVRTSL